MTKDGERFSLKFVSEGEKRLFSTSEKKPKTCNKANETTVYELAQQTQYFTLSKVIILLF